jgi:hypothetical protein
MWSRKGRTCSVPEGGGASSRYRLLTINREMLSSTFLDDDGRPSFNILQNYGSSKAAVLYFVFDVMVLAGRDVMKEPREARRELLEKKILPKLGEPVRYAAPLDASLPVLIESVKAQGLEGLVAKRLGSRYEAGLRSGAWQKMRVNRGQEFVIGGYTGGTKTFDALIFGLRRRPPHVRRAHQKRIHAGRPRATVQEIPRAGDQGLPVRESPGSEERPMGCGPDSGEDERLSVAEACVGRADRVPGMDGRESSPPHQVRLATRGQEPERRYARVRSEWNGSDRQRGVALQQGCQRHRVKTSLRRSLSAP